MELGRKGAWVRGGAEAEQIDGDAVEAVRIFGHTEVRRGRLFSRARPGELGCGKTPISPSSRVAMSFENSSLQSPRSPDRRHATFSMGMAMDLSRTAK